MGKQTAAEVQRRYREKRKLDPNREKAYKEKHNQRNARRPKISEMNKKQQQIQRIKWRTYDRVRRRRQSSVNSNISVAPPSEILPLPSSSKRGSKRKVLLRENLKLKKIIENLQKKRMQVMEQKE
ncbi:hypothetical protein AVEN_27043-1 [Araneus ventricosus]|uniref:Uncharacterized protein n=1 Tax=Araneus ventricosus TaxID=182803 RepID=A0A4Y2K606_ARAVE|nr:hypothetical protein AVEN_27043-1 [Araneus ventricosus]